MGTNENEYIDRAMTYLSNALIELENIADNPAYKHIADNILESIKAMARECQCRHCQLWLLKNEKGEVSIKKEKRKILI